MRKIIVVLLFTLTITACGSKGESESSLDNQGISSKPYAGETINVYNWGDYIAEDTIKDFTDETGIKVNYETFDSNEIMYAKYKSGAVDYDVLIPSDYMIEKLIEEDELLSINWDNVSNVSYIDEVFKGLDYDPNNEYSIPYMWGTVGILYNTTMVDDTVDSWDILWEEKYAGQIIMQNSVRDAFAVALKRLGYSLNTRDKGQIDEAFEMLKAQAPLVQAYVIDEVKDKMIGGEGALAVIYSGEALLTTQENPDLAYAIPKEGTNLWFDAMVIPKKTKHQEAAEAFINYMCEPQIAYNNCTYIGYSTPHAEAKAMLDEEIQKDEAAYPKENVLEGCEVFIDLGSEITQYYNEKWNELKASLN